ncbi:putative cycloheximide resistance protein [Ramaria rubella]|nr:putative cycloheximide resistance protein [Ramaria rubella]
MPLGILEDHHLQHVPGTALLEELLANAKASTPGSSKLKHGTGRSSDIVLVPQPSDDLRDPLNWPVWKREALFWTICYITGLVGAVGPLLAPGYALLGMQWDVGVNEVASANGDLVLGLACFMMLQGPIGVKYGRRPVFLVSALTLFACSIWSAVSKGLTSFLVSRVFQGFGMASFEALVTAIIGEIYFVHQRGFRVAIWSKLSEFFNFSYLRRHLETVNGYILASPKLGWKWTFWILTIFLGIALVAVIVFVPETSTDTGNPHGMTDGTFPTINESLGAKHSDTKEIIAEKPVRQPEIHYLPAKTFLEEMRPWSGYTNSTNLLQIILRPFPFILSPAVWFAIFSLTICWLVVLSIISSVVFALPPYNFDASQTGLVSIGPLVASIVAMFISGPLCDYSAVWFAKKNNGVYEPESRLYLMFPMLVLEVAGYGFWALMQDKGVHWIGKKISSGPVMMYSIINAGQSIGSTAIVTYVIDVHRENAAECFALINFVKNMVLFGFTQFSVAWVTHMGVLHTFGILAGLTALSVLPTIPMYIYGKRARSWVARNPRLFLAD